MFPACPSLQPNVGRYTTGVWTRAYLEQQLRLMLAGRAAEELVFGRDELSSLHQAKLMLAREVSRCRVLRDECSAGPAAVWRTAQKLGWWLCLDNSHSVTCCCNSIQGFRGGEVKTLRSITRRQPGRPSSPKSTQRP